MDRLEICRMAQRSAEEMVDGVAALNDKHYELLKEACTDEQEIVRRLKIILLTDALDLAKEE